MSDALLIAQLKSTLALNSLIHFTARLPLLKRLGLDQLYRSVDSKRLVFLLLSLLNALVSVVKKGIYLFLACFIPILFFAESMELPQFTLAYAQPRFFWIFSGFSLLMGSITLPSLTQNVELKYTLVRMMGMDARRCQIANILLEHVTTALAFFPCLMGACLLMELPVWMGAVLAAELLCARLAGEVFHLSIYRWTGVLINHSMWYLAISIGGCLALSLFPPLIAENLFPIHTILTHPLCAALFAAAGLGSVAVLLRFPRCFRLTIQCYAKQAEALRRVSGEEANFSQVKLSEADLHATLTLPSRFDHLEGWAYLQELFFHRHRRIVYRPFLLTMAAVGVLTVLGSVFIALFPIPELTEVIRLLPSSLPLCMFLLYAVDDNLCARACRAMFHNCDLSLLRYNWYRHPQAILRSFLLRLKKLCLLTGSLSLSLCGMFTVFVLVSGAQADWVSFGLFYASLMVLSVFFSVHCLGMYYLLQPYTSTLERQNPFFTLSSVLMYLFCYLPLRLSDWIDVASHTTLITVTLLAITVVYSVVIFTLVWCRSPKTFRVK